MADANVAELADRRHGANGGSGKSKTAKAKAESPAPAAPTVKRMQLNCTREAFTAFVRDQWALDEKIDALKKQRSKLRKTARASGIPLKAADQFLAMYDQPRTEPTDYIGHLFSFLQWFRKPVQMEMLPLEAVEPPEPPEQSATLDPETRMDASAHGYQAGLRRRGPEENPYDANTEAGQVWLGAFHQGSEASEVEPLSDEDDSD